MKNINTFAVIRDLASCRRLVRHFKDHDYQYGIADVLCKAFQFSYCWYSYFNVEHALYDRTKL